MASNIIRKHLWFFKFLAKAFMQIQKYFTHIVEINNKELTPCIYAMWHSDQFCIYGVEDKGHLSVLISKSVDGEIVAYATESLGFKTVRGSSNKKGAIESTMHMINLLKAGETVAITVDGPSGPLHKVKNGVIKIAQMSGAPIVPVCWYSEDFTFVKFPSWDKMTSPILDCKIVNLYGEPIYVPAELSPEQFEEYREKVRTSLLDLQARIPEEYRKAKKEKLWRKYKK